jgi:hypothetical protein
MSEPLCLRCDGVELVRADEVSPEIAFYACPQCGRRYAQRPGGALTFRWLDPISVALYPVIFTEAPEKVDPLRIDEQFSHVSPDQLAAMAAEIRLELETPTQPVRDILDCRAPEAELRAYLRRFCERAELSPAERQKR